MGYVEKATQQFSEDGLRPRKRRDVFGGCNNEPAHYKTCAEVIQAIAKYAIFRRIRRPGWAICLPNANSMKKIGSMYPLVSIIDN